MPNDNHDEQGRFTSGDGGAHADTKAGLAAGRAEQAASLARRLQNAHEHQDRMGRLASVNATRAAQTGSYAHRQTAKKFYDAAMAAHHTIDRIHQEASAIGVTLSVSKVR